MFYNIPGRSTFQNTKTQKNKSIEFQRNRKCVGEIC